MLLTCSGKENLNEIEVWESEGGLVLNDFYTEEYVMSKMDRPATVPYERDKESDPWDPNKMPLKGQRGRVVRKPQTEEEKKNSPGRRKDDKK